MFELLRILFYVFNVSAMAIVVICCFITVICNIRLRKDASASIGLPTFSDCKKSYICCSVVSSVMLIIDWILISGSYRSGGLFGPQILAEDVLMLAKIWAVITLAVIIIDILIKFIGNSKYKMKDAIVPLVIGMIWYFILAIIIY